MIKVFSNKNVPAKELNLIEKECFSTPWSEESFKTAENTRFYLYFDGEKVVGYVGIYSVLDEGYITNIAVLKDHRKKGVATSLLKELTEKESALSFISLEVRESNAAAISLYTKFNFKKEGVRKAFYSNPKEDGLILTRRQELW